MIVEVEAVSSICPCHPDGRPSSCASQSSVSSSSSVAAGEVAHPIALTFSVAISSSARIPGSEPVFAKNAKNLGWFQSVSPGTISSSKSRRTSANGSAVSGGDAGSFARISPGRTRVITGRSPIVSTYEAAQSDAAARSSRNVTGYGSAEAR